MREILIDFLISNSKKRMRKKTLYSLKILKDKIKTQMNRDWNIFKRLKKQFKERILRQILLRV